MSTLVDDLDLDTARKQREIHLSTGTVLGIFFAAALVCALFFGFGYTAGRRSAITTPAEQTDSSGNSFSNFKPAPGAVAIQPVAGYLSDKEAAAANASAPSQTYTAATSTPAPSQPIITPAVQTVTKPAAPPVKTIQQAEEPAPAPRVVQAVATPAPPSVQPATSSAAQGPAVVQVAAVSHQEDAEVLLSALKRHGYAVFTTSAPADRLIHVQIGPFGSRKEAETMRQRLLADGYNAIVK